MRLSASLSGAAGQYFVAAALSRRGIIALLTLRNARGIDILASNKSGTRSVGIQVKTNQDGGKEWVLHQKAEDLLATNLFYIFVNLNGPNGIPEYHIDESEIVACCIREDHRNWLLGTKKDGSPRKDTTMRMSRDREGMYRNAWNRLGFDTHTGVTSSG
jgi:Holliday junction resolvase-like predicted endonuclease